MREIGFPGSVRQLASDASFTVFNMRTVVPSRSTDAALRGNAEIFAAVR
jgi:hypothetical protein